LQSASGIVGSFPALNAKPQSALREWLQQITEEWAKHDADHPEAPSAPFASRAPASS
jgi:nitronate monooxygenase